MDAGDLDHLYATSSRCPGCHARLAASDDGGTTWRWHDLPAEGPAVIGVVAPRTLVLRSDPVGEQRPRDDEVAREHRRRSELARA